MKKTEDCSHRTQSNPIQPNPIHGWIQSTSNSGIANTCVVENACWYRWL